MADKYENFAELAAAEPTDAWRISYVDRPDSDVLIAAPHAGSIEPFTTALAKAIAGGDYGLYCFEGLKQSNNRDLHITSHHFDEPIALSLVARSSIVLGIHGCRGDAAIYVGGLDKVLLKLLTDELVKAGLPASSTGHGYPAVEPTNICNRSKSKAGAQLEITRDLRQDDDKRARIAAAARAAVAKRLAMLAPERANAPAIAQGMPTWRARFRFLVQKKLNIKAKERHLTIGGRNVVLKAELPDSTIADENWLTMNTRGFTSEEEATGSLKRSKLPVNYLR